ncbi:MAG TPA: uroporphyrinogen decarboxylase family protein [Planctomycetota bacterium]|nr:uroporphyrinogen decarboxylase family protein [Planctomycetota bacterium]HRR79326.1 uroporphyrinogen decarboxylase family protein [Planctomycetota bacterium]HRT95344.1 uroporphyrinogen decarboxylase family protein [Planctomycetota bacterium]
MTYSDRYLAFMGLAPKRIPHWEHWSCPDAETYLTGIDYYEHPKLCRERLRELYPQLELGIPATDEPKPRPKLDLVGQSSTTDGEGYHRVRWGDGETSLWDWGKHFKTADDVFAFSPLERAADFARIPVVESRDYSDEAKLYEAYRKGYPPEWGDHAPEGSTASCGFYNTMFMWPLLTFGWELFLETCLDPRFERIMDEFAEINRRVFRVFARLPVNFVVCHDDIVTSRGPVCSPAWMHKYIFPRYEEFWSIVKAAGKQVIFMVDGCIDAYADDVFACGARGIISEPYTDYKALARRHRDCFLAGEGDNRVLYRNRPAEIEAMVRSMVETARMTGGYMMCIGNHIPWNVPPPAIKLYLDLSAELARR